jgi:hypothetical protein
MPVILETRVVVTLDQIKEAQERLRHCSATPRFAISPANKAGIASDVTMAFQLRLRVAHRLVQLGRLQQGRIFTHERASSYSAAQGNRRGVAYAAAPWGRRS